MDDALFVLLLPRGRYVVFFLVYFSIGAPATNSHEVIGIIITDLDIILIVYIFNFDTAFGVISRCAVFVRVLGIFHRYDIYFIIDAILVLRWFFTRVIISWIFLLYIGCIVLVDIDYFHTLVLCLIHLLNVSGGGGGGGSGGSQWGRGGTLHTISMSSATHNIGIGTGPRCHGVVIYHLLIYG